MAEGRGSVTDVAVPRPTLESVARQAGVSRQTISNVLHAPHRVSADTARRVSDVIAEVGYRPHRAAQQLRTRQSRVLALRAVSAGGDKIFNRFLHALTTAAAAVDYRVMLYAADDDDAEIAAYDELLTHWDIDGLVLTTTHSGDRRTAWLAEAKVPVVTFGRPWDDSDHHCWVDVDGAAGTADATTHLIEQGHRSIGYLGWPESSNLGEDRLSGWRAAVLDAGLPILEPSRSTNDLAQARSAARRLLDDAHPTAVVCSSDVLAVGALAEITARGLRPGTDVAIVGFDDTDLAEVMGLSSVAQPLDQVAAEIIRLVLDQIDKTADASPEQVLLRPALVARDTTESAFGRRAE